MNIVGYYVGPQVDTELGSGTLLCYPWCWDKWREELIDDLLGRGADQRGLIEFGFRRSYEYDEAVTEVERQSVPLFDIEEMDCRPVCDWCLDHAVQYKTTDSLVPLDVALTREGILYEGEQQIDDDDLRNEWRKQDGSFVPYADGGYPFLFLLRSDRRYGFDNEEFEMCATCAAEAITPPHLDEYRLTGRTVYMEGPAIECDGWCGEAIESAYGDPFAEEDEDG